MVPVDEPIPPTIEWRGDHVRLIDQRRLPDVLELLTCATVDELCDAITTMAIRGAPALGAAGAMGVALAHVRGEDIAAAADRLIGTRPTAVNLAWGARRAVAAADPVAEATAIAAEDVARNRALGADGAAIPIERRAADEVLTIADHRIAPAGSRAENRAFDVTPAALVTAYVSEEGLTQGAVAPRR